MTETIKRIVMGVVMTIIVLAAILYLPTIYFFMAVACVLLLTGYEWIGLITDKNVYKNVYCLALLGSFACIYWAMFLSSFARYALLAVLLAIFIGIVQLFVFAYKPHSMFVQNKMLRCVLSLVILSGAQLFITLLRYHGNFWIVYGIGLVVMFDSGAYFSGRAFGKHLLAKKISPKKTWEGFLGGCVLGLLLSVTMMFCFHTAYPLTMGIWILVILITVLMAIFSVWGDLFESLQKRIAGKKDSSNIIPGHGGFFDRIDALLFVLPLMYIYQELLVFLMNRSMLKSMLRILNQ